jgi:hypothetical protein
MTPEEALRILAGTKHQRFSLPEMEEAVDVLAKVLYTAQTDVPVHTIQLIELHNRLSEVEARLNDTETVPDHH